MTLPVWTLNPNWSQGLTERLMWLTDVRASKESACEQRAALRLHPRRSLEALFTLAGAERSFADLWANRVGRGECMVPLWQQRGVLGSAVTAGATTLAVDTVYREFLAGGMALLVGPTPFSCEAVQIDTVSDGALTLSFATANTWPVGTVVHPLRRGRMDAQALSNLTSRVGSSTLRFNLEAVDDGIEIGEMFSYLGRPLITTPPNWSGSIDTSLMWLDATRDSETGKVFIVDPVGRALPGQQHRWLLRGRAEQHQFRQMLYYLAGRARSVWLPTFADDLTVSTAALAGSENLNIDIVGLGYLGGPAPGREHILIGGDSVAHVAGMVEPPSATEERLVLTPGLGSDVAAGARASWIDTSRLDQDEVEIVHHADTDGGAECTLVFRAFDAGRDGSAPGALEIPITEMNSMVCGIPPLRKHELFSPYWVQGSYSRDSAQTYGMYYAGPEGIVGESGKTTVFNLQTESIVADFTNNITWNYGDIVQDAPLSNKISFFGIDSAGTLWGTDASIYPISGNRLLISVEDFGAGAVTVHGQWPADGVVDSNGHDRSCNPGPGHCFDLPGGDRALVWIPSTTTVHADNRAQVFRGGSIETYQPGESWVVSRTMQDEYGDIWLIGFPETTGDISSVYLWRIVENGSSPIVASLAHVTGMPTVSGSPPFLSGFWSEGYFYIFIEQTSTLTRIDPTTMSVVSTYTPTGGSRFLIDRDVVPNSSTVLLGFAFGASFYLLNVADFTVAGTYSVPDWTPGIGAYVTALDYDEGKRAAVGQGHVSVGAGYNTSFGWYFLP